MKRSQARWLLITCVAFFFQFLNLLCVLDTSSQAFLTILLGVLYFLPPFTHRVRTPLPNPESVQLLFHAKPVPQACFPTVK